MKGCFNRQDSQDKAVKLRLPAQPNLIGCSSHDAEILLGFAALTPTYALLVRSEENMTPVVAKKKPVKKDRQLQSKMKNADTLQTQMAAEYKKENLRLQKQYAKMLVKKDSEIARLKAQLTEAKKKSHLIVTRVIVSPSDAKVS